MTQQCRPQSPIRRPAGPQPVPNHRRTLSTALWTTPPTPVWFACRYSPHANKPRRNLLLRANKTVRDCHLNSEIAVWFPSSAGEKHGADKPPRPSVTFEVCGASEGTAVQTKRTHTPPEPPVIPRLRPSLLSGTITETSGHGLNATHVLQNGSVDKISACPPLAVLKARLDGALSNLA